MREMRNYRDYLIERLVSDPEEAIGYLQTSVEEYQKDGDTGAFLIALESIAKAQFENKELASQVYLLSGVAHHSQKEYEWALEDYNTALELNPDNAEAYIYRGLVSHNGGEHDLAIEDFNKAIALNPNHADAYYNRGLAYHNKGEHGRVIEDFNKAIALKPNHADAYYNRGLTYGNRGKYEHAIADFTKAIALKPNYADAYYNRGVVYWVKDDHDRALADYTKAVALNPNNAEAYYNHWQESAHLGVREEARSDRTTARDLRRNITIPLHNAPANVPSVNLPEGIAALPIAL